MDYLWIMESWVVTGQGEQQGGRVVGGRDTYKSLLRPQITGDV